MQIEIRFLLLSAIYSFPYAIKPLELVRELELKSYLNSQSFNIQCWRICSTFHCIQLFAGMYHVSSQ